MERRQKGGFPAGRIRTVAVMAGLVLVVGAAGWILTEDKTQKAQMTNAVVQDTKNQGWEAMETNPLLAGEVGEVSAAVEDYYRTLGDETGFVEDYENLKVYTKLGKEKGTYVAFARYDMRIRDVYTPVPGLGTLYVTEKKEGGCLVEPEVDDPEALACVETLAGHEDVKTLFQETETAYQQAVESDALLLEALQELQETYEDS